MINLIVFLKENPAFWAIIGIFISSILNFLFYLFQSHRDKVKLSSTNRQQKIEELCDFCNLVVEKMKIVTGETITGQVVSLFSANKGFWLETPITKFRIIIQIYFPLCISDFDKFQNSFLSYMNVVQEVMKSNPNLQNLPIALSKELQNRVISFQDEAITQSLYLQSSIASKYFNGSKKIKVLNSVS